MSKTLKKKVAGVTARHRYGNCPLCQGRETTEVHRADARRHQLWRRELGEEVVWMKCGGCGHVFTEGFFTDKARGLMMEGTQGVQDPGMLGHGDRLKAAGLVEKIQATRLHGPGLSWLDVGAGNGALMSTAAEYGFDVYGTDLRKETVEFLDSRGFNVWCCDLEKVSGLFGVVTMCDVLEHMPWPKQALKNAWGVLHDNGLLVVSCPNAGCYFWEAMGDENPYWWEIEHYHNFTRARLESLLTECGFDPVRYAVSDRYLMGMEVYARAV